MARSPFEPLLLLGNGSLDFHFWVESLGAWPPDPQKVKNFLQRGQQQPSFGGANREMARPPPPPPLIKPFQSKSKSRGWGFHLTTRASPPPRPAPWSWPSGCLKVWVTLASGCILGSNYESDSNKLMCFAYSGCGSSMGRFGIANQQYSRII